MQKHWTIKPQVSKEVTELIENSLKLSPLMAKILAQRGLTDETSIRSFFKPEISSLHSPFLMKNMSEAVELLNQTIENMQKIFLFGDYDVDGTTAVALLYTILKDFTEVHYYIPDRYIEGYGISTQGIDRAVELGCSLFISLDCGIKAVDKIAYAREKGLEVIVCDHHEAGNVLPNAVLLDPKQLDCNYPFKELCGCGVGFKLLWGYFEKNELNTNVLLENIDLVAIAIGADIVPMLGENRLLAHYGLTILNQNKRLGIDALIKQSKRILPFSLTDVVFVIAPRINAAGRLDSGMRAVELLIADNEIDAKNIAKEIDDFNAARRELDSETTEEALEIIANDVHSTRRKSTVVYAENWNKGVVGIVASRLIEKNYKPTIVLTKSNDFAVGSARSVKDFNVHEAIAACESLLTQFGGHAFAAGLTLPIENIEKFSAKFEEFVSENIDKKNEIEEIVIDQEINFMDLFLSGESSEGIPRLFSMQEKMEPFGPQNLKPYFLVKNCVATEYSVLKNEHLKLRIHQPGSALFFSGIAFKMADLEEFVAPGCLFDVVFTLESNTWNNQTKLQLMVKDIRESK